MRTSDLVAMCFGNLFRRKLRSVLTIMAVLVGTAMIVIMISIGEGMNLSQEAMLAQMGDLTIIQVMNYGGRTGSGEELVLDDAAVAQMQAMEGVVVATPIYTSSYFTPNLYAGKKDRYQASWANITGVYAEAMPLLGYELIEGEYPTGPQVNQKKPIQVVVGEYMAFSFEDSKSKYNSYTWPETDENGNLIRDPFVDIHTDEIYVSSKMPEKYTNDSDDDQVEVRRELEIVGRLKEDWNKGYETSQGILMDINDLKALEGAYIKENKIAVNQDSQKGYSQVKVKVESMEDVDRVETQIQEMGYDTSSMESIRKPMQEQVRQQQLFLGLIGFVTLVVAAIGIANTMFMSIYERTREIGVMKVLGCRVGNIRSVFLLEAGVIGFIGGCIGVGVSYGISFLINSLSLSGGGGGGGLLGGMFGGMMGGSSTGLPMSVIPLWLAGSAILFATIIGLLSGVLPANRAMRISALEAIKHE